MPAGSYESMADDIALHGFDDGVEKDGDDAANRADQQRKQEKFLIIRQTETVEEVRRPQFYAVPLAPELRALQGKSSERKTISQLPICILASASGECLRERQN